MSQHLNAVKSVQSSLTPTQMDAAVKQNGVKYSELLRLPYFNIITQHVIDAMHNKYLGTAKHIIGDFEFELIQSKIDCMIVPFGIGRIPYKFFSKCSEPTADQWRNWTNVYSLFALHGLLPDIH